MAPGGDKTPEWLRSAYREKHNIELMEGYGTTETSPVISINTPKANKPGNVGKAVSNVRIRITDVDTGKILDAGQEGKILVKGDQVMKGYFDDLESTSLRIRDGWYDTGDMGYLDEDGYLWHSGRLKRFAKIGGEMVSLVHTERALEKLLPDDIECCMVEIPNTKKGASIIAVVTGELNKEEIIKKLSDSLPAIAIPKIFEVIAETPRMGNGKINFREVTSIVKDKYLSHLKEAAVENEARAATEKKAEDKPIAKTE